MIQELQNNTQDGGAHFAKMAKEQPEGVAFIKVTNSEKPPKPRRKNVQKIRKRIKKMIRLLEAGKQVSRARLKRHFGDHALRQLDLEWKDEQKSRNKKPAALVKYARLIRDACYYESLSERYYSRGAFNKKICNKADGLFDAAFAQLREAIDLDGSLSGWLDRGIDEAAPCAAGAPRPIWSTYNTIMGSSKIKNPYRNTKKQLKLSFLYAELGKLTKTKLPPKQPMASFGIQSLRSWRKPDYTGFKV